MSGILSAAEIRYTVISIVGLMILSFMLVSMGFAPETAEYEPEDPEFEEGMEDRTWWESILDPDLFGGDSVIDQIIDVILTPFQIMITLGLAWSNLISAAGWASSFIIIPQMVMLIVVASSFARVLQVAIPG